MGDGTGISWTDATWNPTRGCRRTAPAGSKQSGCGDPSGGGCYAERQAARFCGAGGAYEGLFTLTANGPRWSGKARFVDEHLADPLRWSKPRRIFVDSMSDLFYESFTNEQIAAVFGVMAAAPRHTFQILTKRPRRMREWFAWAARDLTDRQRGIASAPNTARAMLDAAAEYLGTKHSGLNAAWQRLEADEWPLRNVWLGVSVENQAAADERIPDLLATPASIRFLSCEPLLGSVDLTRIGSYRGEPLSALEHVIGIGVDRPALSWVVAGCESGPGMRPCNVEWLRSLRDQCAAAGVPFFAKQAREDAEHGVTFGEGSTRKGGGVIERPYLDGRQHLSFPEVRHE